jgi:hypothetical protein
MNESEILRNVWILYKVPISNLEGYSKCDDIMTARTDNCVVRVKLVCGGMNQSFGERQLKENMNLPFWY